MIAKFCIFIIGHHLLWLGAFGCYGAWARKRGGYRWKSVVGLVLGWCCLGTSALPFLLPARPGRGFPLRSAESLLVAFTAGGLGMLLLGGIVRLGSRLIGREGAGSGGNERSGPPALRERFRLARHRLRDLRARVEQDVGRPVSIVLSEGRMNPFLAGTHPCRIHVPFELLESGVDLGPDLARLARWARTWRHRVFGCFWWVSQGLLLLLPLARSIRVALDAEREGEEGGSVWPLWTVPAGLLVAALAWAGSWAGGFSVRKALGAIIKQPITGYSVNGSDHSTRFHALPGEGGILPAGLRVDTTHTNLDAGCATIRFPLGLFDHERWVPFGAKALSIYLEWEVMVRQPWAAAAPTLKIAASEQEPVDREGQQRLLTFYTRHVFLADQGQRRGVVELAIHLTPATRMLPGSKDVLFGPLVFVPPGWDIAFRGYTIRSVSPSQVRDPPPGEAARFVAWYGRIEHWSSHLDLHWDSRR